MTGGQFRADRAGTFADIVARRPAGRPLRRGPLSGDPARYAAVAGARAFPGDFPEPVEGVRKGTTDARVGRAGKTATGPGASGTAGVGPGDVHVSETPGGGGCGRPSPDPHQAGEEIDDLRAF
ncbi:hypothetical protein [Streptomyces sp. NPDC017086]|uniref:hypothetical protein n=1 Tax=Streptomyces sp. NPDC017086 TaxID=3364976 RepID=UPI0037BDA28D